jgi:hypothetical protein
MQYLKTLTFGAELDELENTIVSVHSQTKWIESPPPCFSTIVCRYFNYVQISRGIEECE